MPTGNPDAVILVDLGAAVLVVIVSAVALLTQLSSQRYVPKFLTWSSAIILAISALLVIKVLEQYLTFP
jgi:uncharacterized membrane-anchored protein